MSKEGQHKRSVVMLVKSKLAESISLIDTDMEDQIWVVLSLWPSLKMGGMYIPPKNSPYSQLAQFSALARHTAYCSKIVIMGDFNSWIGMPRIMDNSGNAYNYRDVRVDAINGHGRILTSVCNNSALVMANHLYHKVRQLGGATPGYRKLIYV